YAFEPGSRDDGVTVLVPVSVLNRVRDADVSWHVPGYRSELVTAMLRGLPKAIRRTLVPLPDVAAELLPQLRPADGSLPQALSRVLLRSRGVEVEPSDFDAAALP